MWFKCIPEKQSCLFLKMASTVILDFENCIGLFKNGHFYFLAKYRLDELKQSADIAF